MSTCSLTCVSMKGKQQVTLQSFNVKGQLRRQTEAFDELAGFIQGENSEDGITAAEVYKEKPSTPWYSLGG